ncbi:MAG: A/G-specific adenine glycosylase [Chloroflexota bacterium]
MSHLPASPAVSPPDAVRIAAVRAGLLGWFAENARDLPWRRTRDPYRILISEIMLQQTHVDRVLPCYHSFLERVPDERSLADAPASDVIRQWKGLGYNRRAVNLQRAVQHVVRELGGVWPREVARLRELPGVGPYTAGAIACFAFEQDASFIDTNMRRVLHRLFAGPDLPAPLAGDREIVALAARVLPPGDGWRWNQGLIEFGALQCTARKPACVVCPLQRQCAAYPAIQGVIAALPRGAARKKEQPFEGSNRWYRGRIIDALRAAHDRDEPGVVLSALGPVVRPDFSDDHLPWLRGLVADLARDGLAAIREDAPAWDAPAGPMVRLPD